MMPKMDGIEAVRIIREEIGTEYARNIPIIALTANTNDVNEEMYLNKGFQAFLPKPLDRTRLDIILREWVRDEELEKTIKDINTNDEPVSKSAGNQDKQALNRKIAGLDYEKGLERFGGDWEPYIEIMRSFSHNTPPLLEYLTKVSSDGTLDENITGYAINVHAIKGSIRGIGAVHLGDMAESLENAAKSKNLNYVLENNTVFINGVKKLIDDLEELLPKIAPQDQKPKKGKPDKDELLKLLAACDRFNIVNAEAAMDEIEKYDYETESGFVLWLRENIKQMNFMEIKERLESY
jgi:CheY-like chemotaxis protein